MSLKSQLVEIQLINSQGKTTKYYTYDGYYSQADRLKIMKEKRAVDKFANTAAIITGLIGYHISRKRMFSPISFRGYQLSPSGLPSASVSFLLSYLLADYAGAQYLSQFENAIILNGQHLPLWENKRYAVNPDRAYFELMDGENNEPSIFHSGLTEEAASRLIPDKIIGSVPKKPTLSNESNTHH